MTTTATSNTATESTKAWVDVIKKFFPGPVPESAMWTDPVEIAAILDSFDFGAEGTPGANYLFFPDGGGIHLDAAMISPFDAGCIDLGSDTRDRSTNAAMRHAYTVKPTALHFFAPGKDLQWAYFMLDADNLKPERPGSERTDTSETVEHSINIPDRWLNERPTQVHRYRRILGGLYLLVNNSSLYNYVDDNLSAGHQQWGIAKTSDVMKASYRKFVNEHGNADFAGWLDKQLAKEGAGR